MKDQKVIAIYSRKSRYTGKGESVENQVGLCRQYIEAAFGKEYAENVAIYEDEGFSGGNLNRPGFQKMMKAAREHGLRAVVVYRLDRISRNISDFSGLIQELSHLDIAFVSIREQFDTATPMGRAMMYIASVFSQLERETIAERIRDNMQELAKTGRWLGGTTPTGYSSESSQYSSQDGKSRKICHLKLIPKEGAVVQKIFALYLETGSLTKTEAELFRLGLKTKQGRDFSRFAIKAILQNPVYVKADEAVFQYFKNSGAELCSEESQFCKGRGIIAYNRTFQEKGKATLYRPVEQWIVSVGKHEGLICSEDWIRVQGLLERNRAKSYSRPRSNQALLTGILFCSCGSRMYPKQTQRRNAQGDFLYSYLCKSKERSKSLRCAQHNLSGNQADTVVIEALRGIPADREELLKTLEREKHLLKEETFPLDAGGNIEQQAEEIRRKIQSLVLSLESFQGSEAAACVRERLEQLLKQQKELQNEEKSREESHWDREGFIQECKSFLPGFNSIPVEQKREIFHSLIEKVTWNGEYMEVVLRKMENLQR